MAKAVRKGVKPVEMPELLDLGNGRLRIELQLGPRLADRIRALGKRQNAAVLAAITGGLKSLLATVTVRLSVHLPVEIVARLGTVAKERGTQKGRLLFARISRYVDAEGVIRLPSYANRRRSYPPGMRPEGTKSTQVQISLPYAQAQGFKKFCRTNGMAQSTFFALEIDGILTYKPKVRDNATES